MKDFRIEISSDLDYENMVVDIIYLDNLIVKLHCDQGIANTQILIFEKHTETPVCNLNYFSFLKILNQAFEKLKEANSIE